MTTRRYEGTELDMFAAAVNWKAYFASWLAPYLGSDVLEVGAGLGGTTKALCRGSETRWVCLEPDPALAGRLVDEVRGGRLPACCQVEVGTLHDFAGPAGFDTVLYIDVLEHIEDDRGELARAAELLRPGGCALVLSPAYQWLYSPFDRAIGHYRRYTKRTLAALTPDSLRLTRMTYLDSVGLLASLGNRLLLRSETPTVRQITFWDKTLVRLSRVVDPLVGHAAGRSVLGVWRK